MLDATGLHDAACGQEPGAPKGCVLTVRGVADADEVVLDALGSLPSRPQVGPQLCRMADGSDACGQESCSKDGLHHQHFPDDHLEEDGAAQRVTVLSIR